MKKLKSTLPNMLLSLTVVSLLSAVILATIYKLTEKPIKEQAEQQRIEAIRDVAPKFDNNPLDETKKIVSDSDTAIIYPARMQGRMVGAAVQASTMNGFGGEIKIMVGFDINGDVRNYAVLSHSETPGLGSKIQEWFRDPKQARSVIGKNPSKVSFYVTKDNGDIDAITAATISSRAFLEVVRKSQSAYLQYIGEGKNQYNAESENNTESKKDKRADARTGASKKKKR